MHICPKGHESTDADFCSECGAKIGQAEAAPQQAAPPQAVAEKCPDCGATRAAEGSAFCEICGYNFETKAHGELKHTDGWTAIVTVDPSLREDGSPDPPAGVGPFTFPLEKPVNLIGRKSDSRAIFPEIPLNFDDAVSHRHALLQVGDNGALALRDIGAANGTRLNGKDLEPLTDAELHDGDEITLGHWTRITLKAAH